MAEITAQDITNLLLVAILGALLWTSFTLENVRQEISRTREYVKKCGLIDVYGESRIKEIAGDLNTLVLYIQTLDRR